QNAGTVAKWVSYTIAPLTAVVVWPRWCAPPPLEASPAARPPRCLGPAFFFNPPIRRMPEHRLCPPHGNVLLNPSLQNFPRSRVNTPLYGAEYVDYPLLIASPK